MARRDHTLRLLAAAAVLASLALIGAAAAQPAAPFSADERRSLVRGELVTRPVTRSIGGYHYLGGTSWRRIPAPPERVWRTILDVDLYPELLPGVDDARVVEDHGDRRVIYVHNRYLFVEASYYARMRVDAAERTVHFELDQNRPHDIVAGHGFLSVDPYRGESIVTWGVLADVGAGLLTGVLRALLQERILTVPSCVREVVEQQRSSC